jgi:hypothetical protein
MTKYLVVNINEAPQIRKSLERICRHLAKEHNRMMLEREAGFRKWLPVCQREVQPFSKAFTKETCEMYGINYDEHFYISVRSYNLKKLVPNESVELVDVIADKFGKPVRCIVAV